MHAFNPLSYLNWHVVLVHRVASFWTYIIINNSFITLSWCLYSHDAKFVPFRQCTPYSKMSKDSLLFLLAKFLELKFYSETYGTRYQGDQSLVCVLTLSTWTMFYNTSYTRQTGCFPVRSHMYTHTCTHSDARSDTHRLDTVDLLDVFVPPWLQDGNKASPKNVV